MDKNWPTVLKTTLSEEGGFSNNPKDPGRATMQGVTQATYDAWRKRCGQVTRSVRSMEPTERDSIYREQYWLAIRGPELPSGIDLLMFDEAVNSGPVRAIRDLQSCLGVGADGHLGLQTLAALRGVNNSYDLVDRLAAKRLGFLRALGNWKYFGKGWANRVARVRSAARQLI